MKKETWISITLFALNIQAFELDLYYRNKGRFREKRDIVFADLSMSEGSGLIAHISLGTPAQNFCVVVDTTLDLTMVISSKAQHPDWSQKRRFNRSFSTTDETALASLSLRDVMTTGVRDFFQLDGYPVGRLIFSLLRSYNPHARLPVLGDGYLGLGHPDTERKITDFSILHVMSANQMIDYKSAAHREEPEPDARIVFGSHGTVNPGDFQMVDADVIRGGWKITVRQLSIPGRGISSRAFVAVLDSTTLLNRASANRANLINTALGATLSENVYVVDCDRVDQLSTLTINLQGAQLSLNPQQYIQKEEVQGQARCFSSIVADPTIRTERMVLGMTFLEHFITIFDEEQQKVGFQPRVC